MVHFYYKINLFCCFIFNLLQIPPCFKIIHLMVYAHFQFSNQNIIFVKFTFYMHSKLYEMCNFSNTHNKGLTLQKRPRNHQGQQVTIQNHHHKTFLPSFISWGHVNSELKMGKLGENGVQMVSYTSPLQRRFKIFMAIKFLSSI